MPPCLTLRNIRYGSRVKWSNPGKGVAPSPTPWCSKLSKRVPSGHPRLWSPTLLTYIYIYCCIAKYKCTCTFINIYLHVEKSLTVNDDCNYERIHFLIKICHSQFIFKRAMFVVCERWVDTRTDCFFFTQVLPRHSSTSFESWLGLLKRGVTKSLWTQSPLSRAGSHFGILSPTDLNRLVSRLYHCLTYTYRCSSVCLHRYISWLTAHSRVNI